MTREELMKALGHIDEDLIAEAAEAPASKKRRKGFRIPSAVAASMVLVIGAGALWGGQIIRKQQLQMEELESRVAVLQQEAGKSAEPEKEAADAQEPQAAPGRVGIPDKSLGITYMVQKNYENLYDRLDAMGAKVRPAAAETYAAYGIVEEAAAEEAEAPAAAPAADGDMGVTSEAMKGDYSRTNIMTEGVDESDIVKTDGKFIYMVQSGSIKITDIRKGIPGDSVNLTVPFEAPSDRILEMYVDGGRMLVITSHAAKVNTGGNSLFAGKGSNYEDTTYAYTFDISDPLKAKLIGQMHQDGSYHTSRKVGDMVYLFTNRWMRLPDTSRKDALKEQNLTSWVPSVNDTPIDAGCIWVPEDGYQSLVVSTFRTDAPAKTVDAKVIMNNYCDVYVGSGHIYIYRGLWTDHDITEIASFGYKDGRITAGDETTVSGAITDKFAINEKGDTLRVLTTDYTASPVSTLFVLDQNMKLLGRIDEIARGEQIYAARYLGDMAYFITYENHDPLFVADLADPSNPKLLGNLEISGFSDYLHGWDKDHILGIGYETDENSNRQGMKLVMFDVSDPAHPKVENTKVIRMQEESKDRRDLWYNSEAVSGSYKAILAAPEKNLIGFAFEYSDWRTGEFYQYYPVLSYNKADGFKLDQQLNMKDFGGSPYEYRGLYAGDTFYLAGCGQVRAYAMERGFDLIG